MNDAPQGCIEDLAEALGALILGHCPSYKDGALLPLEDEAALRKLAILLRQVRQEEANALEEDYAAFSAAAQALTEAEYFMGNYDDPEDGERALREARGEYEKAQTTLAGRLRSLVLAAPEADGHEADQLGDQCAAVGEPATGKSKKNAGRVRKRKAGRKPLKVKNPAKLRRYQEYVKAWRSKPYNTYADCAASFGGNVKAEDIEAAVNYAGKNPNEFPERPRG